MDFQYPKLVNRTSQLVLSKNQIGFEHQSMG
jgi:hypothetical protein